jgi:ABC-type transport system involved in cytochrome bd biosynthesis fused ATPase/permease subunit
MKFFNESWHHRLATFYGPLDTWEDDREVDFCQYFWAATKGAFSVAAITFAGGVAAMMVGDTAAWITAMVVNGMWIYPDDAAMVTALLTAIVSVAALSVLLHIYAINPMISSIKRMSATPIENPESFSFLRTWLYTFKHKVCVPVKVKGTQSK